MPTYPYTPSRGRLRGRTFRTSGEYEQALAGEESRDRMPRSRATARGSANGVTRPMLVGVVSFANLIVSAIPATNADALEQVEIDALVNGAMELARVNRYFANIVVKVCTVQAGTELAFATTAVLARRVVPRLVQRNIIPFPVGIAAEAVSVSLIQAIANGTMPTFSMAETDDQPMVETPDSNGTKPESEPVLVIS